MTFASSRPALFLLLLLGACGTDSSSPPDFEANPIYPLPASQWGGGKVVLASAAFADISQDTLTVAIDNFVVVATRVDDAHFRLVLPPRIPGGIKTLEVDVDGAVGSAQVKVAGIVGDVLVGAVLTDVAPQPWPWDQPTGLLGKTIDNVPVYVDARTGAVQTFSTIRAYTSYTPGTSYRPSIALMRDSAGLTFYDLNLATGAATVDTLNGFNDLRQAYELSPGQQLITKNEYTGLLLNDTLVAYPLASPWYFVRPTSGTLGTFIVNWARYNRVEQLPLVELATKSVVRTVVGIGGTDAAAWSGDGSALYLAAHSAPGQPQRLVRVDPATGTVTAGTEPGSEQWSWWLAVDPTHGWVYDLAGEGDWFQLRIRNPLTLEVLGAPEFPVPSNYSGYSFPLVIPDPGHHKVHVIYETPTGVMIQHLTLP